MEAGVIFLFVWRLPCSVSDCVEWWVRSLKGTVRLPQQSLFLFWPFCFHGSMNWNASQLFPSPIPGIVPGRLARQAPEGCDHSEDYSWALLYMSILACSHVLQSPADPPLGLLWEVDFFSSFFFLYIPYRSSVNLTWYSHLIIPQRFTVPSEIKYGILFQLHMIWGPSIKQGNADSAAFQRISWTRFPCFYRFVPLMQEGFLAFFSHFNSNVIVGLFFLQFLSIQCLIVMIICYYYYIILIYIIYLSIYISI